MNINDERCIMIDGNEYCPSHNNPCEGGNKSIVYKGKNYCPSNPGLNNLRTPGITVDNNMPQPPGITNIYTPQSPSAEGFSLNGINMDNILKAIFFGAIFYLLSLPDVYKITKKCCKSVDGVLLHSIVFAVIYFVVIHFI